MITKSTELKYFTGLFVLSGLSLAALFALFNKYHASGLAQFIETCREVIISTSSLGIHSIGTIVFGLLFFVAFIFLSKSFLTLLKTKRRLEGITPVKSGKFPAKLLSIIKARRLEKDDFLVINTNYDCAFTMGTFRPKIVVSKELVSKLTKSELESVVLHESYHKENRHGLFVILGELISSSLFFVPMIRELTRKMRYAFEKEADYFTIKAQNTNIPLYLALSKIKTTKNLKPFPSFTGEFTKRASMREYQVNKLNIILSLIVGLFAFGLLAVPSKVLARAESAYLSSAKCGENMCSVNCESQNMSYLVVDRLPL